MVINGTILFDFKVFCGENLPQIGSITTL